MTKIQWLINPEGSNFTYEQLEPILTWNLKMVEMASEFEFEPVQPTTLRPGEQPRGQKMFYYAPKEDFSNQRVAAIAAQGAKFNTRYALSLPVTQGVLMHEIGHNYRLRHVLEGEPNFKYSIMSEYNLFGHINRTLLYRPDIIKMNTVPFSNGLVIPPKNVIFADSQFRLMVPAVDYQGGQIWILMQYLQDNILQVKQSSALGHGPMDDIVFENPSTFEGDILTLDQVHTETGTIENVRLKWLNDEDNLLEWQTE